MSVATTVLTNYDTMYKDASADTGNGAGGWWPEEGQHTCIILSVTNSPATFRTGDGQEFPSTLISFRYQLMEDPGSPGEPREFEGAPINLPNDPSQVTAENQQTRIRIELQRLKGHLSTILGGPSAMTNNLPVDLASAAKAVEGQDKAFVVNCQYQNRNGKTYRKDFLVRSL
ncbi:MAG: hypothetical protein ACO395_05125 [Pontimonas sp.]